MKRKTTLLTALLLVCAMLLSGMSGISEPANDPFAAFDPPITVTAGRILTSWMSFDEGEDIDNNWWMRTFRDELGINVEWVWTAPNWGEPYEQKIYTSMATNDLPDYMCVYGSIFKRLVDADLVEDLTEAYDAYGSPFLKETLEGDNGLIKNGATIDGKLLAVGLPEGFNNNYSLAYIRKDWLDNLGLPIPSTFEELEATALAFVTQDPDKNGKDDTYGFALDKEIRIDEFMHMLDVKRGWVEKDGVLIAEKMQDEMKTVLQKLADWYKQGIISQEFAIKDVNSEVVQDLINGRYGIRLAGSSADPQMKDQHKTDPDSDWVFIPLPSVSGGASKQWQTSRVGDFNVVTKGGNTEAAVKMLNLMLQCYSLTDKPAFVNSYDYQNTEQGSLSFFMAPFRMSTRDLGDSSKRLMVWDYINNDKDPATLPYEVQYLHTEISNYLAGETVEYWGTWLENREENSANEMKWKHISEGYLYHDEANWLQTSAEAEFGGDLATRFQEFATKAIMNDDVEAQWAAWVDYYNSNGGAQVDEENNALYRAKLGK